MFRYDNAQCRLQIFRHVAVEQSALHSVAENFRFVLVKWCTLHNALPEKPKLNDAQCTARKA
jgi:hypothetical protein